MRFLRGVVLLVVAAVIPVAGASGGAARPVPTSTGSTTALPSVNMELAVKAAQIDPRRADTTLTTGAKSSVLLVEKALAAKHLLDPQWVDGYFGSKTVDAYVQFQKSLGFSGLDANGLPGTSSLTTLGSNRFVVVNTIGPGPRIDTGNGIMIDTRTRDMLTETERLLGRTLLVDQGSYNPGGDPTSAGTHDGGGVVDVNVDGMTTATYTRVVRTLRTVGFAAWYRTPSQGNWPFHIHAVAINDTDLSRPAQNQISDYYLGFNGLANHAPDDGPRITIRTWEEYRRR